ncbi:hypothetical protein [Citrobacter koseri]|uniref:hypothetical protein n=1 Tax=Citrobacter koseri TaxID=545 RepID=UPI003978D6C5
MSKPTYEYLEAQVKQLEADNEKAMSVLKEANDAVLLAKSKFDALAAENAGLKEANGIALKILNDEETMVTSLWASSVQKVEVETPATEAFLAEVRAQGVDLAIAELNQLAERSEKEAPVGAGHHRSAALFLQLISTQLRKGGAL